MLKNAGRILIFAAVLSTAGGANGMHKMGRPTRKGTASTIRFDMPDDGTYFFSIDRRGKANLIGQTGVNTSSNDTVGLSVTIAMPGAPVAQQNTPKVPVANTQTPALDLSKVSMEKIRSMPPSRTDKRDKIVGTDISVEEFSVWLDVFGNRGIDEILKDYPMVQGDFPVFDRRTNENILI